MNESAVRLSEQCQERAGPGQGEYLGEDGLICCELCRTPVQCRVFLLGAERRMPCMCRCRREALRRAEERQKRLETQMDIQRLKAAGIQEKHLLNWNFSAARDTRSIRMARKYVENWTTARAKNLGLLFWGGVGTGKSFAAACIANALLEQGEPVLMTNFSKILNQMGNFYTDERYSYIASLSRYSLLIIDDLGIERNTEYALEQIYAVADERYKSGLPVVVTTNLPISELRHPADAAHARIYSRVLEMCTPVLVDGEDWRAHIGSAKQELVKNMIL